MSTLHRALQLARYLTLIPHAVGCEAPQRAYGGAEPADLYTTVADGQGGDVMKCRLCGAVERQAPRPAPIPPRSADGVRLCREAVAKLRRDGRRVNQTTIAAGAGVTRETAAGYIRQGWVKLD